MSAAPWTTPRVDAITRDYELIDPYDPWGSAMTAAFALSDLVFAYGDHDDRVALFTLGYDPGMTDPFARCDAQRTTDPASDEYGEVEFPLAEYVAAFDRGDLTIDQALGSLRVLLRYARLLELAGKSY